MKRVWACLMVLSFSWCSQAGANVFAAHLKVAKTPLFCNLSYRLNEPATDVQVEISGPAPSPVVVRTLAGGTAKGLNTVQWDLNDATSELVPQGNYNWRVITTDSSGHTSKYDQISDDNARTSKYYYGCGLCSNVDQNSDYFGCLYVSSGEPGTTDGRTTTEGIYILNNDLSPFNNQGDAAYSGGESWASSWFSPMRVRLDPEGNLFITDWSNLHSGVWRTNPDCSSAFTPVLTEDGRDSAGLCLNHGSIMAASLQGTGANRVLYTIDEDYSAEGETTGSILSYPIGEGDRYSSAPAIVYNDAANGNKIVSSRCQHVKDSTGWWIAQSLVAQSAEAPWLLHWNESVIDYNSGNAPLPITHGYGALAINPAETRLVLGELGYIALLDISESPSSLNLEGEIPAGGDHLQDVTFDAAGNFYQINTSLRRLRGYSPDDGPNTYTTDCPTSQIIEVETTTDSTGISETEWGNYR